MSEKDYRRNRRLISIVYYVLLFAVLFIENACLVNSGMIIVTGIGLMFLYYMVLHRFEKYYESKNENELYILLKKDYHNSKSRFESIYYKYSKYRSSEDLQKQLRIKELQCTYKNDNVDIAILSVAIAAIALMINNFKQIYFGLLNLTYFLFSSVVPEGNNEAFLNICLAILIIIAVNGIIQSLRDYRFRRYIDNIIKEVEHDISDFDECGKNKNSMIVNMIESNIVKEKVILEKHK